jgi:hypothetical protein
MQQKNNAPFNNQVKNQKKGRQKEGDLQPRKLPPEMCLQKYKKQKNPQVPPREQEATESSLLKPMNPPPTP